MAVPSSASYLNRFILSFGFFAMSILDSQDRQGQVGSRVAVYTGSFDPVTLGHLHIIERASPLFDELVIGIGINADKRSLFEPDQRIELVTRVTGHLPNVRVAVFTGLAVDFVKSIKARVCLLYTSPSPRD